MRRSQSIAHRLSVTTPWCVMLHLTFCIGPTRFVIDAPSEPVIARVPLRTLPISEPYVAGLLDFGGTVLAVVDLATRLFGTAYRA